MMDDTWKAVSAAFTANVASVLQLLDFDRVIIQVAVEKLDELAEQLEERNVHSAVQVIRNRADALHKIREHDSLRPQYQAIYNQCAVLLVSYFASAVHRAFRDAVITTLQRDLDLPVTKTELTVSWKGLRAAEGGREAMLADLVVSQNNISFQDMKSIARAFKENLNVVMDRTNQTNDIILGQAARHVIVHAAGTVDQKMVQQVSRAHPRSLLPHPKPGTTILLSPADIRGLSTSMQTYYDALCEALSGAVGPRNGSEST